MHIHPLDLAIVVAYLLGVTALGMHFRRSQTPPSVNQTVDRQAITRDYFLGGRTAPWWALAFSIVATETSTLTIIGTPAIAYGASKLANLMFALELQRRSDAAASLVCGRRSATATI